MPTQKAPTSWNPQVVGNSKLLQWVERWDQVFIDAAASGAFMSKTLKVAKQLIEEIASNYLWKDKRASMKLYTRGERSGVEKVRVML